MSLTRTVFSFLISLKSKVYKKKRTLLALVLLLFGGLFLFTFLINTYFPSDFLRAQLENLLEKSLDGKVTIGNMDVVPLKGLQVDNLMIDSAKTGSIKVDRLFLDYNFSAILGGRLVVNSVIIEKARIELSPPPSVEEIPDEPVSPDASPLELPSIPLDIHLEEFAIRNSDVQIRVDDTKSFSLEEINLRINGGVKDSRAEIKGMISVRNVKATIDDKSVGLPLGLDFRIKSDLIKGDIQVEKFNVSAGPLADVTLNASVYDFLNEKSLALNFALNKFDLSELSRVSAAFHPEKYRGTPLSGILFAKASIKGNIKNSFSGEVTAQLKGEKISVAMNEPALSLAPLNFTIDLTKAGIRKNQPEYGALTLVLKNLNALFFENRLELSHLSAELLIPTMDLPSGDVSGSVGVEIRNLKAFSEKQNVRLDHADIKVSVPSFNVVDSAPESVKASIKVPNFSGGVNSLSTSLSGLEVKADLVGTDPFFKKGKASFSFDLSRVDAEDKIGGFSLLSTGVHLKIPEILLSQKFPGVSGLDLTVKSKGGGFQEHSFSPLSLKVSGNLSRNGLGEMGVDLAEEALNVKLPQIGKLSIPITLSSRLSGDMSTGTFTLKNFTVAADELADIDFNGQVIRTEGEKEHYDFFANLKLVPDIAGLSKIAPSELINLSPFNKSGKTENIIRSTISGKLSHDFMPQSATVSGDVELNHILFNLPSSLLSGKAEKLKVSINSDYSKKSRKLQATISANTSLSDIEQGKLTKDFTVGQAEMNLTAELGTDFSPEKGAFENITADLRLDSKLSSISAPPLPFKTGSVVLSTRISGRAKDPETPTSAYVETITHISGVELPGLRVGSLHTTINAETEKENFFTSSSRVEVDVNSIVYEEKEVKALTDSFSLEAETRQDLKQEKFTLSDLKIRGDDFFEFQGRGSYDLPKNLFFVEAALEKIDFKKIAARLSGSNVDPIKNLNPDGVMTATLTSEGVIPDSAAIKALDFAVNLDAGMTIKNGSGNVGEGRFSGAAMNQTIHFSHKKNNELLFENNFSLKSFTPSQDKPDIKLTNIFENINFSVTDFNEVKIKTLKAGADGTAFMMKGDIEGLRNFLDATPKAKAIKRLYANLQSTTSMSPKYFIKFSEQEAPGSARGEAAVVFDLLKEESGRVILSSRLKTDGLGFQSEDLLIEGVNISVPFKKKFSMVPLEDRGRSNIRGEKSKAAQPIVSGPENLSVDAISAGSMNIQNITGRIELRDSTLLVQELAMNLLDGGVGGSLSVFAGEEPELELTFNFSDINMNELLAENVRVKGDASASGIATVKVVLFHKDEKLDFDTIETSLYITKIGRETLDRILLLVDPEESTPAIIHARSKLKFANPSNIRLVISGGFLALNIDFQQGIVSSVNLDRIPVRSMRNLKFVKRMLGPLNDLSHTMKLIASDSYAVKSDGEVVFFKRKR